jgi:hypothetical protein
MKRNPHPVEQIVGVLRLAERVRLTAGLIRQLSLSVQTSN